MEHLTGAQRKIWERAQPLRATHPQVDAICKKLERQRGAIGTGILISVLGIVITIIILANAIPVLWPMATTASENITAMEGSDAGTTMITSFWPIALMVIGIGIAVAVIFFALREFGLIGS